jgi:microcystin-dependent protein
MPNLAGLILPTPNVSTGWGSTLNSDLTIIDNVFADNGSGTSVGLQVGAGKTLNAGGTVIAGGTLILGSGDNTASVTAPTIRGASIASGTLNTAGANLTISASNGTGTGGSGSIIFRTAPAGTTGSTPNTMQTVLEVKNTGAVEVLGVNLATYAPAGAVISYAGSSAPTGWLLCAGQSLLTASYSALFGAIGYTYGGSGANFNLPDLRGRVVAGKDDMGGTAANRLANTRTIAVSTIAQATTVVTVVTSAANGLDVGDSITISGAGNAVFNGTWTVASVTSSTTFTFTRGTSATITAVAGGTITVAIANGVNGTTLGATGGLSTHTLTIGQTPAHTHTVGIAVRDYSGSGGSSAMYAAGSAVTVTSSSVGSNGPHNNVQPTLVLNYIIKT